MTVFSCSNEECNQSGNAEISKTSVFWNIKMFKENNSTNNLAREGRPQTQKTPEQINNIRRKISRNPKRSMRRLARESNMSSFSMWKIVRGDLNMTPFKFRRRQFLSEAVRVKRRDRGSCLLKWMDRWPRVPIIWSDEKGMLQILVWSVIYDYLRSS